MTDSDIRDSLRSVIDPELGINIVDLGLVYGIEVDGADVRITMTMTSPACPLRDYLIALIESAITERCPGVGAIAVDIVFDPPWGDEMLSDSARRQLR